MGDLSISNGLLCYILFYLWSSPKLVIQIICVCLVVICYKGIQKLHRFKVINLDMVLGLFFFVRLDLVNATL